MQSHIYTHKRPLLQTKLVMPRLHADVVVRSRLLNQLNQAVTEERRLAPRLTLITGPAGYGKTTLTCQWLQQLNLSFAWLSLDDGDNDVARFLAYLFAAVASIQEEIGEAALGRLASTYLYNDTESILTALLNDLATNDETIVLVLDDYHLITADGVHQAISFILQHMPGQLHLLITSRTEPPLPVALLRARRTLQWLNTRDLRFTMQETADFLQQTMSISLSPTQIQDLDEQVEGWATGLQLIALALQEEVSWSQAISGNQRYLVDYLADQVLNRQPAEIQSFLLETAVLPQFNADLCRAVTGRECRALIEQVEKANLFLIPLDAERQWYRYHHLFADFLTGRLTRYRSAEAIATLHRRAAQWYHAHDQSLLAVDHALAAADYPFAADIMTAVARDVLMFGEGRTLRRWIELLPDGMQTSRRRLSLFYAWALIRTGDFSQAATILDDLAEQLDTPLLWGEWSALRARLAVITGDVDINIRFSQKALHKLPPDQHMLRSEVAINLGFSHLQQANVEAARAAFAEAAQNTAHDPGLWAVMFATFYWGQTFERQAQLPAAFEIYRQGLETAEGHHNSQHTSPAAGFIHIGLGNLYYEWNHLPEAESHLRRALACAERSGDHKMLIYSRECMAKLLATLGDWEAADSLVNALEQQTDSAGLSTLRASLALRRNDLATVRYWARSLDISLADPEEKIREWSYAYRLLVRLHLAERRFQGIRPVLDNLAQFADIRNNKYFCLQIELLRALNFAKQGDLQLALANFQQALALAELGGFVRTFLDLEEPSLVRLLHLAAGNGVSTTYAQQLLRHLDLEIADAQPDSEPAIQPLSPREIEVLTHLADGLSNNQIATEMVISVNTVKAHTRRLYNKLDVHSRGQAVARARELQLLGN
jgi:LuxR family maltose regulon positive regulatory protein